MPGLGVLTSQALGPSSVLNWTWLIELIVCGILALFFLFYFNRLFATLVSYGIRAWTWHKFRVWIDIQALQISLLGGRIFFKGVRYYGENEIVLVQSGHITWRYWLRLARQTELNKPSELQKETSSADGEDSEPPSERSIQDDVDAELGKVPKDDTSEARLAIWVSGLEWFVYNRTPGYDAILKQAEDLQAGKVHKNSSNTVDGDAFTSQSEPQVKKNIFRRHHAEDGTTGKVEKEGGLPSTRARSSTDPASMQSTRSKDLDTDSTTPFSQASAIMLRLLPIELECSKGAILLGNESTKALVVTTFKKAKGHIDAGSSGEADIFRQLFDFEIEQPVVQMRPNPDYKRSQLAAAEQILFDSNKRLRKRRWWELHIHLKRSTRKVAHSLRSLFPSGLRSVESIHTAVNAEKNEDVYADYRESEHNIETWQGLNRYMDDDEEDDHQVWSHIDYARFSTILECPAVHLVFYWDMPGQVQEEDLSARVQYAKEDINASDPPAYGLDLIVRGGTVNYGPWTDRLRMELQSAFFPALYMPSSPAANLKPGETRQYTIMTIKVELEDDVSLRIPTREPSKDWQWRGRATAVRDGAMLKKQRQRRHWRFRRGQKSTLGPDIRPFGWMAFIAGADTTVRYDMDMLAGTAGFTNKLELELKNVRVTSSVNHELLWRCPLQKVSGDISNPLGWNDLHNWSFKVQNENMELFMLRDHMFLLIDLIADFTSGSKQEYMTFVPFHYCIDIGFNNVKLYLNANDYNIIDSPADLEDNAFLILGFEKLDGRVDIPLDVYSAPQSIVNFLADGHGASLDLTTPLWNTLHTFLADNRLLSLKSFKMNGAYQSYVQTGPQFTDSLVLDIVGFAPRFNLHGFLIRYFVNVKENYFGEHIHFRTLQEYQELRDSVGSEILYEDRMSSQKDNDLDVILTVRTDQASAVLPSNIYSRNDGIRLDVLLIEADMRFTNYYMDLQVNSSPIEASIEHHGWSHGKETTEISACQLFIESVAIYGHRMFGAPPLEPAYVGNWDLDVGSIVSECEPNFIRLLVTAIQAFDFTLDEHENALPGDHVAAVHDVTFLRARLADTRLWLRTDTEAFLVAVAPSSLGFNDWSRLNFSKDIHAEVPSIEVAAVELKSALRQHDDASEKVVTHAHLKTMLKVGVLNKKTEAHLERGLQQQFIRFHDSKTHRTPWLLHGTPVSANQRPSGWASDPPSMQLPTMPYPLTSDASHQDAVQPREPKHMPEEARTSVSSLGGSQRAQGIANRQSQGVMAKTQHSKPGATLSTIAFASPWAMPHFPLLHVQPDSTELPRAPEQFQGFHVHSSQPHDSLGLPEDEKASHTGLFFHFPRGVLGYCKPPVFKAVSDVIHAMAPKAPEDLLDNIQLTAMSEVASSLKAHKLTTLNDFSFTFPFLSISVLNDTAKEVDAEEDIRDRYDVLLTHCHLVMRSAERSALQDQSVTFNKSLFLFTTIGNVAVEVSEQRLSRSAKEASARLSLDGISFWLGLQKDIRLQLQLSDMQLVTNGKEINALASLIQRTVIMIEGVVGCFEGLDDTMRKQHLVYHLTQKDHHTIDPIFLTRPSYVLRTTEQNVRNNDSWKILSKLRQTLFALRSSRLQKHTDFDCDCSEQELERNAHGHITSCFSRWQAWEDYPHSKIGEFPVMQAIFGALPALAGHVNKPIQVEAIFHRLTVMLDPGPRQSEVSLYDIDLNVQTHDIYQHRTTTNPESALVSEITILAYCSDTAVKVNWDIIDLVSRVGELLPQPSQAVERRNSTTTESENLKTHNKIVVAMGTDTGSLCLDSINIRLIMGLQNFRGSLTLDDSGPRVPGSVTTVLLSSSSAFTKIRHDHRTLTSFQVSMPSVYIASDTIEASSVQSLTLAASCHRLRFSVKEDIVGLLRVAQKVVRDEVRSIVQMLSNLNPSSMAKPSNESQAADAASTELPLLRIGLFLRDYKLSFRLLPDLIYTLSGVVARTSVAPTKKRDLLVSFDIKRHEHFFHSMDDNTDQIPSLRMPPISTSLTIKKIGNIFDLRARLTVEQVRFEAAAIRAVIDAVNQPNISKFVNNASTNIAELRRVVDSTFPKGAAEQHAPVQKASGSNVQYSAHVTLAGFDIHTSAPSIDGSGAQADVNLVLGHTILRLANHRKDLTRPLSLPDFNFSVQELGLRLLRKTRSNETNYGRVAISLYAIGTTEVDEAGKESQTVKAIAPGISVDLYAETASIIVDVAAFVRKRIESFSFVDEDNKTMNPLRRFTLASTEIATGLASSPKKVVKTADSRSRILPSTLLLDIDNIQIKYVLTSAMLVPTDRELEDLILSVEKVDLNITNDGTSRLGITNLQLQLVPKSQDPWTRSASSALLPQIVFKTAYVSTKSDRRFALHAAGKALDLRLAADSVIPAAMLHKSFVVASAALRQGDYVFARKQSIGSEKATATVPVLHQKRLASLLVDADFAGAVVKISPRKELEARSAFSHLKGSRRSRVGRYGQVMHGEGEVAATLRSPGVAVKVEYRDNGKEDPSLSTQIKVAASSNTLFPSVVPLIHEISSSIKEVMEDTKPQELSIQPQPQTQSYFADAASTAASTTDDPTAILGRVKLNAGLWIQRQEFSLSCQPIARVAATAKFDDIFMTVNTVQAAEQERFFSLVTTFNKLQASVQHVYSRESTASFEVDSIAMSLMNSKHISSKTGISAILEVSPMKTDINARQVQDFLLFREIWYPPEMRQAPKPSAEGTTTADSQVYAMQRYQQLAGSATLPWNAIVHIKELSIQVDFGQSLGKSEFQITELWASSNKNSDAMQNLCIGFEQIGIDSSGRLSGFVKLQKFRVRTSITWPLEETATTQAPLVQGSIAFAHLRLKAAFDYAPFAVADISSFEFMIYNVRQGLHSENDRLVGILDGGGVQVFITSAAAAQALGLYQAFERLVQEKQEAYEASLQDLDRFLRRKSVFPSGTFAVSSSNVEASPNTPSKSPKGTFALHTDVVVTLKAIDFGVFPNTFYDTQLLKLDAVDASARFAVATTNNRTHSGLGMALGEVRVALAAVNRPEMKALGEVIVEDVISRATTARGGTILKVPRLVVNMQTWQRSGSNTIEYIFRSTFEGKVDVGWNYSRISFIRGMWTTHTKLLAQRLGKALPVSAVKITAEQHKDGEKKGQEKITAVVQMPQSKYEYIPLEPAVIDTPQLRDLGEATPSLEWIGLHRDKLPNVMHSVIIMSLLEVAREVEDAYARILGSS